MKEGRENEGGTSQGRGLRRGRRVSASLLAGEAGRRGDLEGGGRSLPSWGVDEVSEYLCLLQEEIKPSDPILDLHAAHNTQQQHVAENYMYTPDVLVPTPPTEVCS